MGSIISKINDVYEDYLYICEELNILPYSFKMSSKLRKLHLTRPFFSKTENILLGDD